MNRLPTLCLVAPLLAGAASPALAHYTSSAAPHWHASDTWGLVVVAVLVAAAAWFDRRRR
jgi:hypothetical protein